MKITVPIRIESTPNLREHWAARAKRAREQKTATWYALKAAKAPHALPCTVVLTRVAPRTLDSDNLAAGFKACRDGVALWLQADDADPRILWKYAQRKGEAWTYACEVDIESALVGAKVVA